MMIFLVAKMYYDSTDWYELNGLNGLHLSSFSGHLNIQTHITQGYQTYTTQVSHTLVITSTMFYHTVIAVS